MKIYVLSKRQIESEDFMTSNFNLERPHIIVSIGDPKEKIAIHKGAGTVAIKSLEFHDIEHNEGWRFKLMDAKQAVEILEFIDYYIKTVDYIIVHCHAGLSRSAGVGKFIYRLLSMSKYCEFKQHNTTENIDWLPKDWHNKHCYDLLLDTYNDNKLRFKNLPFIIDKEDLRWKHKI